MAFNGGNADEFIQQVFSPVAVLFVSEDAEAACQKSNLCFAELVSPFATKGFKGKRCDDL